jgi:hypothetical protein
MTNLRDKVPDDVGKVELGFIKRYRKKTEEQAVKLAAQSSRNRRTGECKLVPDIPVAGSSE